MKKLLLFSLLLIASTLSAQFETYITADVGYKMLDQTIENPSIFNDLDDLLGSNVIKDDRRLQEDNVFLMVAVQPDFWYGDLKMSYGIGTLRKFLKVVKSVSLNLYPMRMIPATDGLQIGEVDFTKVIGFRAEYYSDNSLNKFLAEGLAPKQEVLMKLRSSIDFNQSSVYLEYNWQLANRKATPYTFDHFRIGAEVKVFTMRELLDKIF
jgi:hypothetical protein